MNMIKKLMGIVLLIGVVLALILIEGRFNVDQLRETVSSFGPWVPVVLFVIIIITSSIGFIFLVPVGLAALLLNIYSAFIVSILALTIGAAISFYISRGIGRRYVQKRFIDKIEALNKYDNHLKKNGFLAIFFLRLISLVPYELINIAAGLSRIKFSKFIIATLIGITPGTVLMIYFVRTTNDVHSVGFFVSLALLSLFSIIPLFFKKVRKLVFNL